MRNIYKMIWADALHKRKMNNPHIDNKSLVWDELLFLSIMTSFNLLTIIGWLSYYLNGSLYQIELGIVMPGTLIDKIISFCLLIYIPSIIFNYFIIFFKNKHLVMMEEYPSKQGKLALRYVFVSIGILVISAIIGRFLN